jgi:hypothetical protein
VQAAGKICQKRRIFVIGMGGDHHDAAEGIEALQRLPNFDFARNIPLGVKRTK